MLELYREEFAQMDPSDYLTAENLEEYGRLECARKPLGVSLLFFHSSLALQSKPSVAPPQSALALTFQI